MPEPNEVVEKVEEAATRTLGVGRWDRSTIYLEAAEAATENRLPYWAVLVLSGAIATLGLAIDSSAVVIGAMLVAPLLAPVIGLALALAVGDGRLAVQTAAVVLGSTIAVIAMAAALTALLPFHTITLEISARTRPTTLDLAVAVFSGLVGAVVTVARRSRLSAAIPGVAISVALIPPLAVAGFGIGIGRGDLIRGSLLLYGANLAGIVLSGMGVFLLIGMHRKDVLESARRWHREGQPHGLAELVDRPAWVRSLGVFHSAWARVGLVLAFAIALGLPLSETLGQIARESRVERSVADAEAALFDVPGRASILGRRIVYGSGGAQVYLRVATTEWFGGAAREDFERRASAAASEPVRLVLEQLPARGEDLDQLRKLFPGPEPITASAAPAPSGLAELLTAARGRLAEAVETLTLPDAASVLATELMTGGGGQVVVGLVYAAPEPLGDQAHEMLRRQLERAVDIDALDLRLRHVSTAPRPLTPADTATVAEVAALLRSHESLWVEVLEPVDAQPVSGAAEAAATRIREGGVEAERVVVGRAPGSGIRLRIRTRAE